MVTERGRTLLNQWIYVLVKVGDAFVVPYTAQRWDAVAGDRSYGAGFVPLLERFLEALEQGSWAAGSYYPGGWYRKLGAQGQASSRAIIDPAAMAPFWQEEVRVLRDGRWFVGQTPVRGRVLQHFLRNLHYDAELGRYAIRYPLAEHMETRYLHHESPPVRVRRVTLEGRGAVLWLNTDRREPLRPETLRMDAAEQLYCAVGPEALPAWFEEPARWELLKDADERDGGWVLHLAGRELTAPLGAPWPYAHGLPT